MEIQTEGKAKFYAPTGKITRKLPVFYNPVMELNRTISVQLLKAVGGKRVIGDILAGTGIRSIRFAKETKNVKELIVNDWNPYAAKTIAKNLKLNKVKAKVTSGDANKIMREYLFDYIDIDPFGSPNPFLDSAIQRLRNNGILAVTATDTAALSGTSVNACRRKYWSLPRRGHMQHELGLRILIRKVQLIGAQYDMAMIPVYTHATEHYMRTYLVAQRGKQKVDAVLEQHKHLRIDGLNFGFSDNSKDPGPFWIGPLWDPAISDKITVNRMTEIIKSESKIPVFGFHDIHETCSKLKIMVPKTEKIMNALREKGFTCSLTHFTDTGVRTNATYEEWEKILKLIH